MLYSDTVDPVEREKDDELFFLRIEAMPLPDNPEASDTGGAFVNGLVSAPTLRDAEQKMLEELDREGWEPVRFDHWELTCRECYCAAFEDPQEQNDAGRDFDAALEYGANLSFFTWPLAERD
jgi:hypothetical protein